MLLQVVKLIEAYGHGLRTQVVLLGLCEYLIYQHLYQVDAVHYTRMVSVRILHE